MYSWSILCMHDFMLWLHFYFMPCFCMCIPCFHHLWILWKMLCQKWRNTSYDNITSESCDVYKRDVFVTSWRFHNRACQLQQCSRSFVLNIIVNQHSGFDQSAMLTSYFAHPDFSHPHNFHKRHLPPGTSPFFHTKFETNRWLSARLQ